MPAHDRLSPSKRQQWSLCPGSVRKQRNLEEKPSEYAIDGTHSHTVLERCLKQRVPASYFVGYTMQDHEGEFVVDTDRAQRVQVAFDYIQSQLVKAIQESGEPKNWKVIPETKVSLERLTGRTDLKGTVDVQIHTPGKLEIVDYKDGTTFIDAMNNPQLEQYAIGVLSGYTEGDYPWHTIQMTIVQPKNELKGLSPISTWILTTEELLSRIPNLIEQANRTDAEDAPLVPGDLQCKYCLAKGSCTAMMDHVTTQMGLVPDSDIIDQAVKKDPSSMTNDQLSKIMEAVPLFRQFIEGVEEEIFNRIQSGKKVAGFKIVKGRGSRSWNLDDDKIAEKLIKMGVPKSHVYETSVITRPKVDKLKWTKKDGSVKSLTKIQLERIDKEYVKTSDGKLTLVPESDSRPSVITSAESLFKDTTKQLPSWLKVKE